MCIVLVNSQLATQPCVLSILHSNLPGMHSMIQVIGPSTYVNRAEIGEKGKGKPH